MSKHPGQIPRFLDEPDFFRLSNRAALQFPNLGALLLIYMHNWKAIREIGNLLLHTAWRELHNVDLWPESDLRYSTLHGSSFGAVFFPAFSDRFSLENPPQLLQYATHCLNNAVSQRLPTALRPRFSAALLAVPEKDDLVPPDITKCLHDGIAHLHQTRRVHQVLLMHPGKIRVASMILDPRIREQVAIYAAADQAQQRFEWTDGDPDPARRASVIITDAAGAFLACHFSQKLFVIITDRPEAVPNPWKNIIGFVLPNSPRLTNDVLNIINQHIRELAGGPDSPPATKLSIG